MKENNRMGKKPKKKKKNKSGVIKGDHFSKNIVLRSLQNPSPKYGIS